ncbi:MAG: ArsA family ATPase [Desulfatibacillaceae bacterium]
MRSQGGKVGDSNIFDKRILFITGKGGVGKTTVAAAIAYAARDRGKRVCLVEVGASPNLRYIFEQDIPEYEETRVDRDITAFTLEPYKALEEYVGLQLRVEAAARMILNNRIIHYFMQAAPGWRELVMLGKIWHIHQLTEGRKKRLRFDTIVVDAPATGHGLSFLRAPSIFMNIIKFGPMHSQTFDVNSMLTDKQRTAVCVVATPEEMPVNEAVRILETTSGPLNMNNAVTFANSVYSPLFSREGAAGYNAFKQDAEALEKFKRMFPDKGEAVLNAAVEREKRADQSVEYLDLMEKQIGPPIIKIPHLYPGRVDLDGVKTIAKLIDDSLKGAT